VHTAIGDLIGRERRAAIGEAIVAGYRRIPETEEELADRAGVARRARRVACRPPSAQDLPCARRRGRLLVTAVRRGLDAVDRGGRQAR
jgi:hypothetical protein